MLNKLPPIDDEAAEDSARENSETRMMRALEAMSGPARPAGDPSGARDPGFGARRGPARDPFRAEQTGHGGATKPRHRFVRDGEVTVVHMQPARPREAPPQTGRADTDWTRLQAQLEEMRLKLEQSERTRGELQNQLRNLSTQLAHVDLIRSDAQKLADARAEEITALTVDLARAKAAPVRAAAAPALTAAPVDTPFGAPTTRIAAADETPPRRGPGRPRRQPVADLQEPEPVQWWLLPAKPRRR